MVQEISTLAHGSPIAHAIDSTDEANSIRSIFQVSADRTEKFHTKYQKHVLDYITEWEAVVSGKVDKEQAVVKELRKTFLHYQSKVEGLRKKVNQAKSGKGDVPDTVTEKLDRNTEKLDEASQAFEAAAAPLCYLIEEVVRNGWKDLLPVLFAMMDLESEHCQHRYDVMQAWNRGQILEAAAPAEAALAKKVIKAALKK
jgi:hypothetical protein